MPIDLEMLLSASSSLFNPYTVHTTTYSENSYDVSSLFTRNHCVPRSLSKHHYFFQKNLRQETYESTSLYASKNALSRREIYSRRKKKVSFADDVGLNLVEVCEIPGVPKWADDVITLLIGSTERSVIKEKKWKVAFEHPPWPDEKLGDTIEQNFVALQHVAVKEGTEDFLFGTVKVKNLAFQKDVLLRVTFDRWQSFVDIPCTYLEPIQESSGLNTYDTFCFSTKISPVASRYEVIEFCICFKCDFKEYWDNNGGINYRLIMEYSKSSGPH